MKPAVSCTTWHAADDVGRRLFAAEAGEGFGVVDGDRATTTATITTRGTITTFAATSAAAAASTTEVATIATFATITTITALTTTTASATTAATSTSTRVAGLFLERVVDIDEFLGVAATFALTSGLLFTLEVVLVFGTNKSLRTLPLLVLLSTLVGGTSLLQTEAFELLCSFLGKVVGVGLGVILWLGLSLFGDLTVVLDGDSVAFRIECLAITVGGCFLALLVGLSFAGLLISPFAVASLFAPAMTNLLLVIASRVVSRL
jgi:hypothetical protein